MDENHSQPGDLIIFDWYDGGQGKDVRIHEGDAEGDDPDAVRIVPSFPHACGVGIYRAITGSCSPPRPSSGTKGSSS